MVLALQLFILHKKINKKAELKKLSKIVMSKCWYLTYLIVRSGMTIFAKKYTKIPLYDFLSGPKKMSSILAKITFLAHFWPLPNPIFYHHPPPTTHFSNFS